MIDLSRIRSLEELEAIKKDLTEFLADPDVQQVYLVDYEWSEDDYEADREKVIDLLDKVEKRIVSLKKFLAKETDELGTLTVATVKVQEVQQD